MPIYGPRSHIENKLEIVFVIKTKGIKIRGDRDDVPRVVTSPVEMYGCYDVVFALVYWVEELSDQGILPKFFLVDVGGGWVSLGGSGGDC